MSRTARPVNELRAMTAIVLQITECAQQELPCPTIAQLAAISGLPRRRVNEFLADLARRKVIEIESEGTRRRLRVFGRAWTDWSRRDDFERAREIRWTDADRRRLRRLRWTIGVLARADLSRRRAAGADDEAKRSGGGDTNGEGRRGTTGEGRGGTTGEGRGSAPARDEGEG
jgi:hypothetical protein